MRLIWEASDQNLSWVIRSNRSEQSYHEASDQIKINRSSDQIKPFSIRSVWILTCPTSLNFCIRSIWISVSDQFEDFNSDEHHKIWICISSNWMHILDRFIIRSILVLEICSKIDNWLVNLNNYRSIKIGRRTEKIPSFKIDQPNSRISSIKHGFWIEIIIWTHLIHQFTLKFII